MKKVSSNKEKEYSGITLLAGSNNNYNANISRSYYFVTNVRKWNNNKNKVSETNV